MKYRVRFEGPGGTQAVEVDAWDHHSALREALKSYHPETAGNLESQLLHQEATATIMRTAFDSPELQELGERFEAVRAALVVLNKHHTQVHHDGSLDMMVDRVVAAGFLAADHPDRWRNLRQLQESEEVG